MEPRDKLKSWMASRNYTYVTLAHEMGLSETYIFKLLDGSKRMSGAFEWRFAKRFGLAESSKVFEIPQLVVQD